MTIPPCEVHENCHQPVVAKVGVPSPSAKWACEEGFYEFQGNPRCPATVGVNSTSQQCRLRAGHGDKDGKPTPHRSGTTTWSFG